MNSPIWLHVTLIACVVGNGLAISEENKGLNYIENEIEILNRQLDKLRTSRSGSALGITNAAIKALLRGAEEVHTNSPVYKKFVKIGTKENAITDFHAANPAKVYMDRRTYAMEGVVDDILLTLKTKDRRQRRKPSILISDPGIEKPIKLVYYDKL